MQETSEIRHLSNTILEDIVRIFGNDDSALSLLMGNIVRDPNDENCSDLRFSSADIDGVRNHARLQSRSPFLILFDEWSTMGRDRPKLKYLLSLLIKCQLFKAADYIAGVIGRPPPQRPVTGPAAAVDISLSDEPVPLVNGLSRSSIDSVNRNRPDNRPAINAPNLDNLINSEVPPNSRSVNFSLPMIPHHVASSTRSNNQTHSSPQLVDLNSNRTAVPQLGRSSVSTDLIPAISALHVTSQIPATVQAEQSAPDSVVIPALSGLIAAESTNLTNESPVVMPIMDLDSSRSGPAFSRIFADTGIQKSSTQSTMQSSDVSDSEEDSDDS